MKGNPRRGGRGVGAFYTFPRRRPKLNSIGSQNDGYTDTLAAGTIPIVIEGVEFKRGTCAHISISLMTVFLSSGGEAQRWVGALRRRQRCG